MLGRTRLFRALGLVLAPILALAPGCGGSILTTGADCASVCGHIASCEGVADADGD